MKKSGMYSGGMIMVSFLTVILIFAFTLGLTSAYFHNIQEINGKINLSSFKVDTLGISKSESGELKLMLKTEDGNKPFEIEMASSDDEYEIVNPTISSSEKVSPVYIRSSLTMTDYYGNELFENEIQKVFSEIPTYSKAWVRDGEWYYLSTEDVQSSNMTKYEGSDEVKLFETTKFVFNKSDDLNNIFEMLKEINLSLKIEYVEASDEGYSLWFKEEEIDKEFGVEVENSEEEIEVDELEEDEAEENQKTESEKEILEEEKEEDKLMTLEEVEKEVEIKTEEKVVKKSA